jgi:hypothetical protein
MPTPRSNSGSSIASHASKRRRTEVYDENDDDETPTQETPTEETSARSLANEEDENSKWYDPNQDQRERREVRTKIRNNHRDMEAARDELVKPDNDGLLSHIDLGNQYMHNVRQTADAVLDSRFLVSAGELALKKTSNSLRGDATVSLDLDQFVSKCITFMRLGGRTAEEGDEAPASTQARNRRHTTAVADEDDEEEDSGDGLDWAVLGSLACYPTNKRPPVASFLLGPLSVQKRVRTTQVRRGKSQRQPIGPATKPQELQLSDLKQSESSNLTHLVKNIKAVMEDHIVKNSEEIEQELSRVEGADDAAFHEACKRRRISLTTDAEPCVSLFDFTINPRSFGQTVENLFYISFLIREGVVRVSRDEDGLPLLIPAEPHSVQQHREQNVMKHQAVFSLDWPTWKKLIRAFDIKNPLIPHRESEEATVSAKGWYG